MYRRPPGPGRPPTRNRHRAATVRRAAGTGGVVAQGGHIAPCGPVWRFPGGAGAAGAPRYREPEAWLIGHGLGQYVASRPKGTVSAIPWYEARGRGPGAALGRQAAGIGGAGQTLRKFAQSHRPLPHAPRPASVISPLRPTTDSGTRWTRRSVAHTISRTEFSDSGPILWPKNASNAVLPPSLLPTWRATRG